MTAKRFWKFIPDTCNPYGVVIRIVDNETGKQHGNVDDYVDLLNDLAEENEQLKSEIEKLSYANEDLLFEKRNWQRMSDEYAKLYEENEQCKMMIATLRNIILENGIDAD